MSQTVIADATAASQASTPDAPAPPRVRPVPTSHRVLELSAGQIIVWQLAALAVEVSPAGPVRYAAIGLAAVAVALTAGRGRGGWWYQQLGRRLRHRRHPAAAALTVSTAVTPDCALTWDGGAWVTVLSVRFDTPLLDLAAPRRTLPFASLARLAGDGISAVRLVVRTPGGTADGCARAWLTLRGPAGVTHVADVAALLHRRAVRAQRMLADHDLPADVLDEPALRLALAEAAGDLPAGRAAGPAPDPDAAVDPVQHWSHVAIGDRTEVCLRLAGAPAKDTLAGLMRRLAEVPADAVTVGLTLTLAADAPPVRAADHGLRYDIGANVDLRLSLGPHQTPARARAAAERIAAGWRPRRRTGEQFTAFADTQPIGRFAGPAGAAPDYAVPQERADWLDVPLPQGGLPAGFTADGTAVAVNLSGLARPRRIGILGELATARLLVARTLDTGLAVVVSTNRPDAWAGLLDTALTDQLTVVPAGAPVPAHPVRQTALVRDDPEPPQPLDDDTRPVIDLLPVLTARTAATLRRYDLVVLSRSTQIDTLGTCYDVPAREGRWLAQLPADVLALAVPGRVVYSRLAPPAGHPHIERT